MALKLSGEFENLSSDILLSPPLQMQGRGKDLKRETSPKQSMQLPEGSKSIQGMVSLVMSSTSSDSGPKTPVSSVEGSIPLWVLA